MINWKELEEKYPKSVAEFKEWIDNYKIEHNFTELFNQGVCSHTVTPKFHDLPIALQIGIFSEYVHSYSVKYEGETSNFANEVKDMIEEFFQEVE